MQKSSKQFTLIELLITMTIAIILMGLVGQNLMKKPAGIRRREAINQIKVCFSDARMLALATNSKTAIELSADGRKIQVIQVDRPVSPFAKSTRMLEEEQAGEVVKKHRIIARPISFELPNGCKIESLNEDIELESEQPIKLFFFYPEGEASGEGFRLITGIKNFNIEVDRLTGKLILIENDDL